MIPHERSLVKRMEGRPFALIGINSDRDKNVIEQKNKEREVTWRSFWCGEKGTGGPIPTLWNVKGWPTVYYINHKGVIVKKNVRGEAEMDKLIDELVAAAEKDLKKAKK